MKTTVYPLGIENTVLRHVKGDLGFVAKLNVLDKNEIHVWGEDVSASQSTPKLTSHSRHVAQHNRSLRLYAEVSLVCSNLVFLGLLLIRFSITGRVPVHNRRRQQDAQPKVGE